MAITLAPDALSDAEITDGIGLGDLESAARLWVRHWPTALEAARQYVSPDEVPGLAAEALIATVSAIAIGRGPHEDVHGFVLEAVRELGEDDEPPAGGADHPPVFVSPMMTNSFAELDPELQDTLRTAVAVGQLDDQGLRALTVLQHYYLAEHTDRAETPACRRAHIAMMSVADSSATEGIPRKTWLHMSTCAWCTEAFHEVAFSNVALGALIEPAVLNPPAATVGAPLESFDTVAAPYEIAAVAAPFEIDEPVPVEHPTDVEDAPVPEEDEDDEAVALVGAAHAGNRRGRLIAIGIAAAAAASVLGVILLGQNDDTAAPTAAGIDTTTQAAPSDDATPTEDSVDPVTGSPSGFATVDAPLAPTKAATSKAPTTSNPTKAATKPASTPTRSNPSTPAPTSQPTTSEPTPTPTPTATPTKPCNRLQHLLRIC